MKARRTVKILAAACALVASSVALANPTAITLGNGYGSTNGGEFEAKLVSGTVTPFQAASVLAGTANGTSFITFCLEKNEYFSSPNWTATGGTSNTLYVKGIGDGARNGGVGGQTTPTSNYDPISYQTAYLYTQFSKGTLSNYNYLDAGRVADANDLQNAFWYLENELGTTLFSSLSTQTKNWITEANDKIALNQWSGIGNVRVLNLYKNYNPTTGVYSNISQDQLYMTTPVPEPETYAMMLAGLGLIGFLAKRRRRNLL